MSIKKWVSNNKLLFVVLLVVAYLYLNGGVLEMFAIADLKVKEINNALDSIIGCEKSNKCEGVVANFGQFKKKLGYPNFSVVLFNDLLNKRKEKDEHLTREELVFIVEKGKFEDSFTTSKKDEKKRPS
jgi:hypothetical protein